MTLRIVIVADDLTGALDTTVPFVTAGLSTAVAVTHGSLVDALQAGTAVVAVNTASRGLSPGEAVRRIAAVGETIEDARPPVVLKKIDSRMRGHVAAETDTLARALGSSRIVVAPAVPDQGRFTVDGHVVGAGVEAPIPIAPLFGATAVTVDVFDAKTDTQLDAVVEEHAGALLVGARGLGAALARRLGDPSLPAPRRLPRSRLTLFAVGSRDPITAAQASYLVASVPGVTEIAAPDGALPEQTEARLPIVLRCTGSGAAEAEAVAHRFAAGVGRFLSASRPETLVISGGETAQAILGAVGVEIVSVLGEAAPGLPWFEIPGPGDGRAGALVRCVAKSGGFGGVAAFADLIA